MRRRLIQLGLFVLAGAIVNVAVAWGCSIWSAETFSEVRECRPPHPLWWTRFPQWFDRPEVVPTVEVRGFGMGGVAMGADLWACVIREPGWPCRTFQYGVEYLEGTQGSPWCSRAWRVPDWVPWVASERRFVPFHPLVVGFAINTPFYAGILWLMFAAPFALHCRWRIKRGLCVACAYPIGSSEVCTECGAPLKRREMTK
jgi:hypothetical protein